MARGEPGKNRPPGPGLAIGALFACACLAAVTLIATTTRSCDGCLPRGWMAGTTPAEPFSGAAAAIDELHWPDVGRARDAYARPTAPDASAAAVALRTRLEQRGYVAVADRAPEILTLPLETRTPALAGACGVVVVTGLGNATILGAEAAEGAVVANDPSIVAIAACGDVALRASGTGSATVEAWHMPGITPADVAATGLPAEVVLAHAEAETLWRARGWAPVDQLVREEHGPGPTVWISPPGVPPASGCIAWVGVAIGAGSAETSTGFVMGRDYAIGRALFGAAQCATTAATHTTLLDEGGDGHVVHWRAYGVATPGPTRAAAPGATATTAGALRVVAVSDLALPGALPELPPP